MNTCVTRSLWLILFFAGTVALTRCGGEGGNGDDDGDGAESELTDEQEDNASKLVSSTFNTATAVPDVSLSVPLGRSLTRQLVIDCANGGTMSVENAVSESNFSLVFDDCTYVLDEVTYVSNGTLSISETGGTITITFDLDTMAGSESYSTTGTVEVTGNTYVFDITGVFGGESFNVEGTLTIVDSIVDGTITITVDSVSATCVFDSLNAETATEEDIAESCGF